MDFFMPHMMRGTVHAFGWRAKADHRLAFTDQNGKDLDHMSRMKALTETLILATMINPVKVTKTVISQMCPVVDVSSGSDDGLFVDSDDALSSEDANASVSWQN